ncbi:flavodoxin family protein [Desulfoferula mesophila]|uniref:NADPH-dependent FMN reductase-like domain-containing protein n=1 Tax=Desulfoferula mesophila TaxID=3058419 RepID=A0AAU9EZH1_9BACT|nr:hypothetical protein FAK_30020 [Desulfoferula mesophilus]
MKLNLLGISASPRGKANSYYLLTQAMQAVRESEPEAEITVYDFKNKTFGGCIHCYGCRKKGHEGQCTIKDDYQELADLWVQADAIIYSVPVYHMSIPGQLKCFIDRLGQSGITKSLPSASQTGFTKSLKPMGIISQGMHIFSGQEHAITELVNHALLMGCLPVAGNLWQGYLGASGWTECLADRKALAQLSEQGTIGAQAAVDAARTLGHNVITLAQVVRAGREVVFGQGKD